MKISLSHTTPQFEKDFIGLPKQIQTKAKRKIMLFEANTFHNSFDAHKLHGVLSNFWSFSVDIDYRIIFRFLPNKEVIYYRIGLHKIYRELEKLF